MVPRNEDISWDDDEFDDAFDSIDRIPMNQDGVESGTDTILDYSKKDEDAPAGDETTIPSGSQPQVYDDWLGVATSNPTKKEDVAIDQERYLTRQFQSLNTPASRKKPRCLECTRPLTTNDEIADRLCQRCQP